VASFSSESARLKRTETLPDVWLLLRYQFRATFLTIGVSLWFLVRLWRQGELFGGTGTLFCVWFLLAAVTQLFVASTGLWILGLLAQLALAIVLIVKQQLSDIA
jgi:hypothetical protein